MFVERRRKLLPPCRITNEAKEIYQALNKPIDDPLVQNRETLLPGGKRGLLEATVKKPLLDAIGEDEVDLVETDYWFNPPAGKALGCGFMPVHHYGAYIPQASMVRQVHGPDKVPCIPTIAICSQAWGTMRRPGQQCSHPGHTQHPVLSKHQV